MILLLDIYPAPDAVDSEKRFTLSLKRINAT